MRVFRLSLSAFGLAILLCCPVVSANDPVDTHSELHLIPWPKSLKPAIGHMAITSESRIVVRDDSLEPLAEVLTEEIAKVTGLRLKSAAGKSRAGDIVLKLNPKLQAGEPILMLRNREPIRTTDGAHTIAIDEQAVVEGFDYRATAEGTATLLQLLGKSANALRLPKVVIEDWPHADYCGAMLDVARQDHSIDDIKKVVQLCRLYKGTTTLARGVLKLNKPANAFTIPGNLVVGGSLPENNRDSVIWENDGQVAESSTVTLQGTQRSILDLNGHKAIFANLHLSKAAIVRTGPGGTLRVRQLFVDGKRLQDGTYRAPQPWMEGTGTVAVDSRVDIKGDIASPESWIGLGNIGNLTGNTKIGYPSSGGDFDIATNSFTLALDSGDGNAFAYSGSIFGTGNVEFFMGPSYTGFRDAPLLLTGKKPNTSTGKFLVKKGRVQLEKPVGVDAISGDAIVGGQGFNDCLFWKNSHQIKDTANITLLDAGNSGAAYLHLNGCTETVAGLTMTANNKVLTDSAEGKRGILTVKSLTIGGVGKPAGTYTTATEKWIEGKGQVVVQP